MSEQLSAVNIGHNVIKKYIEPGAVCLDATAGRGNDSLFLCGLVGKNGKVLAFDIQEEAVNSTAKLLKANGYTENAKVICDSHVNMANYVEPDSVACIIFNFGWLPGSDHQIATQAETSVTAIARALDLLKPGGLMSLCIYYGKDTGFAEKEAILHYCETVDDKRYTVLKTEYHNRFNCPPIMIFIFKK